MRLILIFSLVYFCIIGSSFEGTVYAAEDSHPHEAALKNPDGTWKWTNALIGEISPYLLLHAHNPVDWYPWGPEALDRAKAENKPIFLSVGYSTCYWCHVMERKVFSDPEIADQMNTLFVNIKVDREERPDIDEIYMTATQIMTGSGGWPNSVFLTPDLLPFFGGTYFPPEDSRGRPGFPRVLNALHEVWTNQQAEVIAQAEKITEVIIQATAAAPASIGEAPLDRKLISAAVKSLQSRYDATHGGFGGAPKFPSSMNLELLLSEYQREFSESILEMVTNTLDK
ncbi:thioredoxin, partial [Candidatus Poribacteria bacterium]